MGEGQHQALAVAGEPQEMALAEAVDAAAFLASQGDKAQAERVYRQVLQQTAAAHHGLGLIALERRDEPARVPLMLLGLAAYADPSNARYQVSYGFALAKVGRPVEAEKALVQAQALDPNLASIHVLRGILELKATRHEAAVAAFQEALRLDPHAEHVWNNLGTALLLTGQICSATEALETAIALDPTNVDGWKSLLIAWLERGDFERAREIAERAPPTQAILSATLLYANADPTLCEAELGRMHREAGERMEAAVVEEDRERPVQAPPDATALVETADRKLRIGYVSSDFREHSVAYFISGLLEHHDRSAFDVVVYSGVVGGDGMTQRLRALPSTWREIAALKDADVADLIRRDAIDVLVDLGGHSASGRLGIFARKPAPVQVELVGYTNTSGLRAMDYFVTDAIVDPLDQPRSFTEEIVRVEAPYLCYEAPAWAPDVRPRPLDAPLVFAAFHNNGKISDATVELWSQVLCALPESTLLVKNLVLADPLCRDALAARFQRHGVSADRIQATKADADQAVHFGRYGDVDVTLDAFPYSGTTTTCESLWMGVPVLSMAGTTRASRVSATLLRAVGLGHLVTETAGELVRAATRLASDRAALAELRRTLRDRFRASPLADAAANARKMESAYRAMYEAKSGREARDG
jgi:predicted O-linked N-acetylglucosamine transferase (SPINDLY family)